MATVRKRTWTSGDKERISWVADYSDQNGKRHIKTFKLKKAAEDWLTKTRGEVKKGTHTPDFKGITLGDAAERWVLAKENEGLRGSTIRCCRERIQSWITPSPLAHKKIADLDAGAFEAFFAGLARSASLTTAHAALRVLKEITFFAYRRHWVNRNVADEYNPQALMKIRKQVGKDVPTKEDVQLLIASAPPGWPRDIITVAALTGLRSGELRALHWEDIDFKNRVINVCRAADDLSAIHPPKTWAGQRRVPLSPMVFDTLSRRRDYRPVAPGGNVVELARTKPAGYVFLMDVVQRNNQKWVKAPASERLRLGRSNIGTLMRGLQHKIGMVETNGDIAEGKSKHGEGLRRLKDWDQASRRVIPIIKEIQELGITTQRGIARELMARGIPTIRGGREWTALVVRDIMRRPVRPKYSFHTLRHFAASLFIEQGFSAKRVQEIMGHTTIQMTFDLYGHLFPSPEGDQQKMAGAEAALFATSRNKP